MFGPSLILPGPSRRPRPFSKVQDSGVHWSRSLVAKLSPTWGRSPWDGFPCAKSSIRPQETEPHKDVTKDDHNDDSNGTDIDGYVVVGSVEEELPPRSDDDWGQDWVDDFTPDVSKESPTKKDDNAAQVTTVDGTSHEIDVTAARPEIPDVISAPRDNDINNRAAEHDLTHSVHHEAWKRLESSSMDTMSPEVGHYETETLDVKYLPIWTTGAKWTSGTDASLSTTGMTPKGRVPDGVEPNVGKKYYKFQPLTDPPMESMKRVLASEHKDKRRDLLHRYSQQIRRLKIAGNYVNIANRFMLDGSSCAEIFPPDQICCDHHQETPTWRSSLGIAETIWIRTAIILGCLAKQLCDGQPLSPDTRDAWGEPYEAVNNICHAYGISPSPACQKEFKYQMKLKASRELNSRRTSGINPWAALKVAPVSSTKSGNSTVEQKPEDLNTLSRPPKTGKADDAKSESAPARSPVWKPKLASSSAPLKPIRDPRLPGETSEFSVIRNGRRWRS